MEEDVGRRASRFTLLIYCKANRGLRRMTSWIGRCDAISVDRRLIRGFDPREESRSPARCAEGIGE